MRPVLLIGLICLMFWMTTSSIVKAFDDEFDFYNRFYKWNGGSRSQQPVTEKNSWDTHKTRNSNTDSDSEPEPEVDYHCWSSFWFITTIILAVITTLLLMTICFLVFSHARFNRRRSVVVECQQQTSQQRQPRVGRNLAAGPSAPVHANIQTRGTRAPVLASTRTRPIGFQDQPPPSYNQLYPNLNMSNAEKV